MIDIDHYIRQLTGLLQVQFGDRLVYVGLQGSYLRGEATPNSDLDIMVVLGGLTVSDLEAYRAIIKSLPHADKSCGFICSKSDLAAWNPLEVCHLLHSTKDHFGILRELVPAWTPQDLSSFIKISLNNLYHELCHRYIHGTRAETEAALPGIYKGVFFILQNLRYLTHGTFPATKADLLQTLDGKNRAVLERSMALNGGTAFDFQDNFELLFSWCQETLQAV